MMVLEWITGPRRFFLIVLFLPLIALLDPGLTSLGWTYELNGDMSRTKLSVCTD